MGVLNIGKKGSSFFKRRASKYNLSKQFSLGGAPTIKEAQAMADELFAEFVSAEVDKVELLYTKFVSLINSQPTIQTLLQWLDQENFVTLMASVSISRKM